MSKKEKKKGKKLLFHPEILAMMAKESKFRCSLLKE
jgi:hypothetical protein